jgi:hypothetical protein
LDPFYNISEEKRSKEIRFVGRGFCGFGLFGFWNVWCDDFGRVRMFVLVFDFRPGGVSSFF